MKGPNAAILLLTCLSGNAFAAPAGVATGVEALNDAVSVKTTMQERNAPPAKFMNEMEARDAASEQEVKALRKMLVENPTLATALEKFPIVGSIIAQVVRGGVMKRDDIKVNVGDDQIKALQKMVTEVPVVGGLLKKIHIIGPILDGLLGGFLGGGKGGVAGINLGDLTGALSGVTGGLGGLTGDLTELLPKREESAEQDEALRIPIVSDLLDKIPIAGDIVNALLGATDGLTGGVASGVLDTAGSLANGVTGGLVDDIADTAGDIVGGTTGGILKRAEVTITEQDAEILRKYAETIPILSSLPVIGPILEALGL